MQPREGEGLLGIVFAPVLHGGWAHLSANTVPTLVLVFGWLAHLMVRGFFTGRAREIALGLLLVVVSGGVLVGVLPGQPGISWQGYLFGALGGGVAAYVERRRRSTGSSR